MLSVLREQGPGVSVETSSIPLDLQRKKPDDQTCCDARLPFDIPSRGTINWWRLADLRYWQLETSDVRVQQSIRFWGALFCRHRWTVTLSLFWTHCGMSSKWSSEWSSWDKLQSNFQVPLPRWAPIKACRWWSLAPQSARCYSSRHEMHWECVKYTVYVLKSWCLVQIDMFIIKTLSFGVWSRYFNNANQNIRW